MNSHKKSESGLRNLAFNLPRRNRKMKNPENMFYGKIFVVSEMLMSIRNHMKLTFIGIVLFEVLALSLAQRVAPGVPPQQYVSENTQYHNGNVATVLSFLTFI